MGIGDDKGQFARTEITRFKLSKYPGLLDVRRSLFKNIKFEFEFLFQILDIL